MSILDMDIDGLIFETFSWNFHHTRVAAGHNAGGGGGPGAGLGVGAGYVGPLPQVSVAPPAPASVQQGASKAGPSGSSSQHAPSLSAPASLFPPPSLMISTGSDQAAASGPQGLWQVPPTPPGGPSEIGTPTGAQAPAAASASPFAAAELDEAMVTSIPLKPGGTHLKVG